MKGRKPRDSSENEGEDDSESTSKQGIFDSETIDRLQAAADPESEWVPIWLMMRLGMHPKDLARIHAGHLKMGTVHWRLQWKRAKNGEPRKETLPDDVEPRVRAYLRNESRPRTANAFFYLAKRVGERVGLPNVSPMTLRHTACYLFLEQYKDHPSQLWIVAHRMGCSLNVVIQNYVDFDQWVKLGRKAAS